MKKYIILIAAIVVASATSLEGQVYYEAPQRIYYSPQAARQYKIDWQPDKVVTDVYYDGTGYDLSREKGNRTAGDRYTVALRPLYLFQYGLKLDFEMELNKSGDWLQFGLTGNYSGDFDSDNDYYRPHDGWSSEFLSAGDNFYSLRGLGGAVRYKHFFSRSGWYYAVGASLNYYNVEYYGTKYVDFTEDGLNYIREEHGLIRTNYYKPEVRFDLGKHIALSRRLFLDLYFGVGYTHSFFKDDNYYDYYDYYSYNKFSNSNYGFASRGIIVDFGLRIGWLFGK